jgi:hypothetical protein
MSPNASHLTRVALPLVKSDLRRTINGLLLPSLPSIHALADTLSCDPFATSPFSRQLSAFSHRYTVLRNGRQRLLVPNSHFVNREFLVTDAGPMVARPAKIRTDPSRGVKSGRTGGTNGPPPQPGMPSQKVAPNGLEKRGGFFPTLSSRLGPGQMPSGPGVPSPHGK